MYYVMKIDEFLCLLCTLILIKIKIFETINQAIEYLNTLLLLEISSI